MIEDKKTNFPPVLKEQYERLFKTGSELIEARQFPLALKVYQEMLKTILEAQGEKLRYHKGGAYHQIGYSLFLTGAYEEALKNTLYAFIEDCITLHSFPILPAFQNLKAYNIGYPDLHRFFSEIIAATQKHTPLTPEDHFASTVTRLLASRPLMKKERNVFVGGNYKNIAILRYIEDRVIENHFNPILAINFREERSDSIYMHSMLLLEDSSYAIFETTFDSGHLMEIEKARGQMQHKNVLLLFQKRSPQEEDHYISKMLFGIGSKPMGYLRVEDLKDIIKDFLTNILAGTTTTSVITSSNDKGQITTTDP